MEIDEKIDDFLLFADQRELFLAETFGGNTQKVIDFPQHECRWNGY